MKALLSTLLVLALCVAPVARAEDDEGWTGDVAVILGAHDNFFFRGSDAPAPTSDMVSVVGNGEWLRESGKGELAVVVGGTAVLVSDIDSADYQIANLGVEYKRGPFKYGGTVALLLNRLFIEEGDPVFFDERALEGWARYSVSERLWLRGTMEVAAQDFDAVENDRDADVLKFDITARWALTSSLGVRIAYLWEERDATGPRNDRDGSGFALGLEGRPSERITFSARVRQRDREYPNAPSGDSNFGRDDTVTDFNLNLRWRLGQRWGLVIRDEYRKGESTRLDRNFNGNYIGAGLYLEF